MAEGYCSRIALNKDDEIVGYEFINFGKMMDFIKKGSEPTEALKKATGHYGQFENAAKYIDPRQRVRREGTTMALFESYERRIDKINGVLKQIRHRLRGAVPRDLPGKGL